ncbi:MAG: chorismate--pyruvate lyase family protein [Pseudomonadota bacterium]
MSLHSGIALVPMPTASPRSRPPLAWLRAPGSLTRHLARVCPGRLVVEVLCEGWAEADPASARLLGLRIGARVWRREVRLSCRHAGEWTPYVHAITLSSPEAHRMLGLARLGRRPLGSLLFRGGARRLSLETLPIRRVLDGRPPKGFRPWKAERSSMRDQRIGTCRMASPKGAAPGGNGPRWARRSLFLLRGHRLLVREDFLPGLPSFRR